MRYHLRLGLEAQRCTRGPADYCIAANAAAFRASRDQLRRGAICILDSDGGTIEPDEARFLDVVPLSLRRAALDAGAPGALAAAGAGVVAFLLNIPIEAAASLLEAGAPGLEPAGPRAAAAARAAWQLASERLAGKSTRTAHAAKATDARWSTAMANVARGMIAGGARFVSAVPDATGSAALSAFDAAQTDFPQKATVARFASAPDAGAAALGASFAGVPAVWIAHSASLGNAGSLSAFAALAEIPLVIVNIQKTQPFGRAFEGFGSPDLMSSIHGSPGMAGCCVLALSDPAVAFEMGWEAVRIAEEFQLPVKLLLESAMLNQGTPAPSDHERVAATRRSTTGTAEEYRRYEPTPGGVSPMALPGGTALGYVASAVEHDPSGRAASPGKDFEASCQKRARKLELLRIQAERSELLSGSELVPELENFEAVVIGFGGSFGAASEGCALAGREGLRVLHIHPRMLWPLPRRVLARVRDRFDEKHVLVLDENPGGDLWRLLRSELSLRGTSLRKYDGTCLRNVDVLARIREVFGQK